jgi:hypothetical protein
MYLARPSLSAAFAFLPAAVVVVPGDRITDHAFAVRSEAIAPRVMPAGKRLVFEDRAKLSADPASTRVPANWLVAKEYAAEMGKPISMTNAARIFDAGAFSVAMPLGWYVTGDASKGLVLAQQDPKRKDAAQILFLLATGTTATEDQVIDTIAGQTAQNLTVVQRGPLPSGGGKLLIADGVADGNKVRLGAIAVGTNGALMLGLLVATPGDFDALGGLELVSATMATVKASGSAPPAAPADPGPAAPTGGTSAPVYDHGQLVVPPPTRPIMRADLVGEWKHDDSSITNYVSASTGQYAGFSSIQYAESWSISPGGEVKWKFHGATASSSGAHLVDEDVVGTIAIAVDGTITVTRKSGQNQYYLLRGWFVGPEITVMKINGPWYSGGIPDDVRADPHMGYNLDEYWVRKTTSVR